jgi:ATP-dependent helicase HrpB
VNLPIDEVLPELKRALADGGSAVVQAPPGAGKTTRVPLALLDAPWLGLGRIVMLEPRRLAARAAAAYMARLLGEQVGGTVGYRVRMDTRVSARTRVEVVTEGVLTRMLQMDPALEGVGLLIFDEFHERSVHADLGLALALQSRSVLRPELRIVVMSATLDAAPVAALLDDATVVSSAGRTYPVEVRWRDRRVEGRIEDATAATVRGALADTEGDVLVFLPGAAEIRRVEALLGGSDDGRWDAPVRSDRRRAGEAAATVRGAAGVRLHVLHGRLTQAAQDAAIAKSPPGRRKVVLATSIAETSLTIEGIRTVVDAGLMRVPRFSPRTGLTALETVPVTRASAEQRCGRAGRLGPGVCYRLWSEAEHASKRERGVAEILEADLAPLALELAVWAVRDPAELRWLDLPPAAALAQARELLRDLDALTTDGSITPHGRRMAGLALHPRLAHMLLRARSLGLAATAADVAALLAERDIARGDGPVDPDVASRLHALDSLRPNDRSSRGAASGPERADSPPAPHVRGKPAQRAPTPQRSDMVGGVRIDPGAARRTLADSAQWRRRLGVHPRETSSPDDAGLLLAFAYPDRIAAARPGARGRFLLRNGRGAEMDAASALAAAPFVVAADIEGHGRNSRIHLAARLEAAELDRHFGGAIERDELVEWDAGSGAVRALRRTRLGAIILAEAPWRDVDPERVADVLFEAVRTGGLERLPWSPAAARLRQRLAFLHAVDDRWPDVGDQALLERAGDWLRPFLAGLRSLDELKRVDLGGALLSLVPWELRARLDSLAPTHLDVPSGSRVPIDYSDPSAPAVAVRLQEVFGMTETPLVAGVPLTMRLLSPAQRPVQITRDLASFWKEGYFDVRKDLRGRYPKHSWPDDPLTAEATRRTRRRGD